MNLDGLPFRRRFGIDLREESIHRIGEYFEPVLKVLVRFVQLSLLNRVLEEVLFIWVDLNHSRQVHRLHFRLLAAWHDADSTNHLWRTASLNRRGNQVGPGKSNWFREGW